MKKTASTNPAPGTLAPFEKGQVWKIGDLNVAVTQVGKTLVHFKCYRTKRHGNQTTLASKPELEKYLISNKAILVSE